MSLGDMWAAEVRATVAADGTVRADGHTYWCPELGRLAGREVFVWVPVRDGAPAQVWNGDCYQCSPERLADTGFADADAAKAAAARLRFAMARPEHQAAKREAEDRRASIVRLQAQLLLELLGDRGDYPRVGILTIMLRKAVKQVQLLKKHFIKARNDLVESEADGDLQGSNTLDARLKIAQRIFEIGQFGFSGHIDPPLRDGTEPGEPADGAHRLSGGAK